MKVEAECAGCLLSRGVSEAYMATTNPALRFRTICEIIKLLNKEFKPTSVSADIGTKRERLIQKLTLNSDPYKQIKKLSNKKAMELVPHAQLFIDEGYSQQDRFKRACLISIVGNIMEFDIPGHAFTLKDLRKTIKTAAKDLYIDDIDQAYELAVQAGEVLLLSDNAGEIVFDGLLVEQLKNMGVKVTYVVKGAPTLNDTTMDDVEFTGMDKLADKVMTTGTDAIGLQIKLVSPEFLKVYEDAKLVFAKGMGYAETLTEYQLTKPHLLMFRTKCTPVANYFCAPRHKNIAKLMP
ncbi:MAG: ARMT1-like domain-containing protein [Candidatus Bathyarchaeota archaeon]|nr:ARMT1-like domain-containing protein [Candidatus Bathyarchaeota archaeon]